MDSGDRAIIFLDDHTSKGWFPGLADSPWLENWQECFKKVCISKGKRKKYNEEISKVNTLRKRRRRSSAVWPSAIWKGLSEKEVRHLEAERKPPKI